MSTFVFLLTSIPHSQERTAIIRTASGPPAPPETFAAAPTATSVNKTREEAPIAYPIPTAIAAPTT